MVKTGLKYPKFKKKSLERINGLIKQKKKVADYKSNNVKKFTNPMNDKSESEYKRRARRRR